MNWNKPEFSKEQVNHAGDILKLEELFHPERQWAENVLTNWRSAHAYPINTFNVTLRRRLRKIEREGLVAQRLKRTPSIINKLQRFGTMRLARMQDIAGLRAIVKQVKSVRVLEKCYKESNFSHNLVSQKDYITHPKISGYRGIHLVYRYNNTVAPEYNGLQLELQVRTKLQHAWATAVETIGTFLDQSLKSSEGAEEWLDFFALTSSAFAHLEKSPPVPQYSSISIRETYEKVLSWAEKQDIANRLNAFSIATNAIRNVDKGGSYHLIVLNLKEKNLRIFNFPKKKLEEANEKYTDFEKKMLNGDPFQVVLVSTDSIKALRKAYPNYFLDTRQFLLELNKLKTELGKI